MLIAVDVVVDWVSKRSSSIFQDSRSLRKIQKDLWEVVRLGRTFHDWWICRGSPGTAIIIGTSSSSLAIAKLRRSFVLRMAKCRGKALVWRPLIDHA